MNVLNFVGRIGRDAELRDANGTPVINLAVAYNYGRKDNDGKRPTQWVDCSLWGNRAEALHQYLVKGQAVAIAMKDVHVHTYDKSDGSLGTSLRGEAIEISLVGGAPQQNDQGGQQARGNGGGQQRSQGQQQRPAARSNTNTQQRQAPARSGGGGNSGFDDMDDDIPF